jgi:hypothetical protein
MKIGPAITQHSHALYVARYFLEAVRFIKRMDVSAHGVANQRDMPPTITMTKTEHTSSGRGIDVLNRGSVVGRV